MRDQESRGTPRAFGLSHVFISYARSTEAQARQIGEALKALGYDVWRDDELPAHRSYAEVIEERLKAAKAVVVVWSADATRSQWVQSEADRARADRKLVQLSVDGAPLPVIEGAGEGRGGDVARHARDRDCRRDADEDQERRHQEAAADAEHAGDEADRQPHPQNDEDVDGQVGDRKVDLQGDVFRRSKCEGSIARAAPSGRSPCG